MAGRRHRRRFLRAVGTREEREHRSGPDAGAASPAAARTKGSGCAERESWSWRPPWAFTVPLAPESRQVRGRARKSLRKTARNARSAHAIFRPGKGFFRATVATARRYGAKRRDGARRPLAEARRNGFSLGHPATRSSRALAGPVLDSNDSRRPGQRPARSSC
jgi:hypothetical protein